MTSVRDRYVGKTMRLVGEAGTVYAVTGVAYNVEAGQDSLHVRRIKPLPPAESIPKLIGQLEECQVDELASRRDGLSQLVARTSNKAVGIWTTFNSRTEFKEYQFRPLMKFLDSPERRVIIADEVGLGKTIEAAYIIVEELASGDSKRVLVLCPGGLRLKWQEELWHRFGLHFQLTDGSRLKHLLSSKGRFMAIASYDSRWDAETDFVNTYGPIDLLVVDEVHNLIGRGGETQRRTMAFSLAKRSSAVVALSATPIHLEMDDFRRVMEVTLGRKIDRSAFDSDAEKARQINRIVHKLESEIPMSAFDIEEIESGIGAFEDGAARAAISKSRTGRLDTRGKGELILSVARASPFERLMTRTRKKDVGGLIARRVHNHVVPLDDGPRLMEGSMSHPRISERSLYWEIDKLLEDSFSHVHRLQLSSCLPAMVDLLKGGMKGFDVWQRGDQLESELSVMDHGDQGDFRRVGGSLPAEARERCAELVDRFGLVRVDSKFSRLRSTLELLREPREDRRPHKAIIFTQWRHTWEYLARRLDKLEGVRALALSGDDDSRKVVTTLKEFNDFDGPAVLVSTDFLSEGLDMQVADVLVNYDFPYNPQRVEQRIGRVDRIGQNASEITIHNLVVSGSLDEDMLAILRDRLEIFKQGLGDAPAILESRNAGKTATESHAIEQRRLASEKQLQDALPLKGVEAMLDERIRHIRSTRSGDLERLSWTMVLRMLSVFSGGRAKVVEETPDFLRVGPLDDGDVQAVCEAVGAMWSGITRSEILSQRDENLILRIAKTPGGDGLYYSPLNLTIRTARLVTMNSFGSQDEHGSPLCLRSKTLPVDYVAIFDYTYRRQRGTERTLTYWWQSAGKVEKVTGENLARLVEVLQTTDLETTIADEQPPDLQAELKRDFAQWCDTMSSRQREPPAGADSTLGSALEHIATIYKG